MDEVQKTANPRVTAGAGRGNALGGGRMSANVRPVVAEAAGMGEAMSTLLAQGSGQKWDKKSQQFKYADGRFKGLTRDQVVEKGKEMWDKASPAIREKYAARVRNRPTATENERAGGRMAAFAGEEEGIGFDDGTQDLGGHN